jgi:hypothetical protein
VAALALLGLGCVQSRGTKTKSTLAIVPTSVDLAAVTVNQRASATVELRNVGADVAGIRATASSTRCQWQGLPGALVAGEVIKVSVTCQSDLLGPLREQLSLLGAGQSEVLVTLTVVGRIEPIVGFDTTFVDLRPAFGTEQSVEVHVIGERARQVAPKVVSEGGKVVLVTVVAGDGDQPPSLRVTCQGDTVGMHAGNLVLDTGLPEQPTLSLSWGCRVAGTLTVDPATPYFNLRTGGEPAATLVVRSTQPGFMVKSVRVTEGPFSATRAKPNPDGSFSIVIRVKPGELPDDARSASGKLMIQSNDAREPHKEVPLFGFGKINKQGLN